MPRWAEDVVAARPYSDLDNLRKAYESALELSEGELGSALARHPLFGERREGCGELDNDPATEREEAVTALRDIALLRLDQVVTE